MKKKLLIIFGLVLGVFSITFFSCKNFLTHAYKTPDNNPNVKEKAKTNESEKAEDSNIKEDVIENEEELNNSTSQDENNLENAVTTEDKSTVKEENTKTETPAKENTTTQSKPSTNTTTVKEDTTKKETTTDNKKTETNTNTSTTLSTSTNTNKGTTTEPKKETKTLVNTEDVTERELKSEKYGTKFYTEKHYTLSSYSDGTTKKDLIYTVSTVMDVSGFNGTAASMMDEAKALVEANRKTYNELLAIVNGYRAEKGASPLELDENLTIAATIRAMEMAYTNDMNHTRPNGNSCFDIFEELGVPPMYTSGENIAAGYFTPKLVAEGWKKSPGHYSNMINANFKKIGLGMMRLQGTTYGIYWAQMFTS